MILGFDEAGLKHELEALRPQARVALAAACAERLRPVYVRFAKATRRGADAVAFEGMLDRLWGDLSGDTMSEIELTSNVKRALAIIPDEDDGDNDWTDAQGQAEDAGTALVYALKCRISGDEQDAAWAARRVYEALDRYVMDREHLDEDSPDVESTIVEHRLIQAELRRQRADLDDLRSSPASMLRTVIGRIRTRAKNDAQRVFAL